MFSVTVNGESRRDSNGIRGIYKYEEKAFQVAACIILREVRNNNIYDREEYDELLKKASKLNTWEEVYQLVCHIGIVLSVTVENEGEIDIKYPDNIKHTLLKNLSDYQPENIIYSVYISAGEETSESEYIASFKSEENAYEQASKELIHLIELSSYPEDTHSFEECKNETSWVGVFGKLHSILETLDYGQYVYVDKINVDDIGESDVGNIHEYFKNIST